ncbi:MAG: hypothetical protein AB8B55_05380 [Mariniblastus sp.]
MKRKLRLGVAIKTRFGIDPRMISSFRRFASNVLFTVFVVSQATLGFTQEPLATFKPTQDKIRKIVASLNLMAFDCEGKKLRPILELSPEAAHERFKNRDVFQLMGIESVDPSWSRTGVFLGGRAGYGFGRSNFYEIGGDGRYWLFVEDNSPAGAVLKIQASEAGEVLLDFRANHSSSMIRLRQQSKGGSVFCQCCTQGRLYVASGSSFDDFCRNNAEFVQRQLAPLFEHVGLGPFPNRYARKVTKAVLASIQPIDDARMEKFQSAIVGLDSGSFAEREAVMGLLKKNARDWRRPIQLSMNNDQYSVEARNRLKNIFEDSTTKQDVDILDFASREKLADDPSYLIWLLEGSKNKKARLTPEVKKILASKLEKLTGESHGEDLKEWNSWLRQNEPSVDNPSFATMTDQQMLEFDGPLEKAKKHVGKLLRFKVKGDHLMLDREHWERPFGGKSIKELTEQVKTQMKELNLPEAWLVAGGKYPIANTEHPQVLFEKMAEELPHPPAQNRNMSTRPKTFDRTFVGNDLKAVMKMRTVRTKHVQLGSFGVPEFTEERSQAVEIMFSELTSDFCRKITCKDSSDGSVTLMFEYPAQDALIQIVQQKSSDTKSKDHFTIHDIRGPNAKLYRASSFAEFKSDNPKYYDGLLAPILRKLDILIDD